jgi:hypothetical protein
MNDIVSGAGHGHFEWFLHEATSRIEVNNKRLLSYFVFKILSYLAFLLTYFGFLGGDIVFRKKCYKNWSSF